MKYTNTITYKSIHALNPNLPLFFIVGRCTCGSRHYSEMLTYEKALSIMPKYIGVVDYFGGGTIELVDYNGNVLKRKSV